ncbi:MAG: hypothetical protein LUQ16_09580 [Methanomassiliicoccales archaeon]|nr:hypothetical protein [Methanomassiliicoccales archaeon]
MSMANCWRCGNPLSRPDSRFCDSCGASVSSPSGGCAAHEDHDDFDRNVALLFTITGVGAMVIGIFGAVAFLRLTDTFPGIELYSALAIIGGLAVGGVFLYLAYRIKERR